MNDWMLLYLWTRLDWIHWLGIGMTIIGAPLSIFCVMASRIEADARLLAVAKRLIAVPVVGLVIVTVIPTKADMVVIVGQDVLLGLRR
ncbi:MAG: hypothetical protein AB7K86_08540 [Rhodospirillales bacterium]